MKGKEFPYCGGGDFCDFPPDSYPCLTAEYQFTSSTLQAYFEMGAAGQFIYLFIYLQNI